MAKQLNSYEVKLDFKADTSQAKKEIEQFQQSLTGLITKGGGQFSLAKDLGTDLSKAMSTVTQLKENLKQAFNVDTGKLDLGKFQESMIKSGNTLETYKASLIALGPEGSKAFNQLANHIAAAEIPLRRTNGLLTEFWTTLKNTARWQISSSLLHGFMGAIHSAYGYAQDLNESLNNIRIVTGYNTDKMAEFAANANKAAQAFSVSTTAYTDAALIYYQQGLGDEEVLGRTDVTVKMANVSRQSAEEVSDQLTAIWNNFYDGSKSLEYYADVITALGAATASSSEEISTGLEKFAAVADTVGLSYEYATAALATITATTRQSAETVGTGLRTLFARLEGLKLGETLEDGVDLNKYSKALETVGVQILDVNGEIKDMDTILDETAAKWDTLSKAQQVAFAQTVGGVRQYTNLIALMDNWDFMQSNLEVASDAEGTLQEQADIYAESWEAAQKRVKAAAEDIYGALLDDKFFIQLNNIFADLLKGIKTFTDNIGGLKGVLLVLGTVATTVFNKQIGKSLADLSYNFKSMTGQLMSGTMGLKDQAFDLANNKKGTTVQSNTNYNLNQSDQSLMQVYAHNQQNFSKERQEIIEEQLRQYRLESEQLVVQASEVDNLTKVVNREKEQTAEIVKQKNLNGSVLKDYVQEAEIIGKLTANSEKIAGFTETDFRKNKKIKLEELDKLIFDGQSASDLKRALLNVVDGEVIEQIQSSIKNGTTEGLKDNLSKLVEGLNVDVGGFHFQNTDQFLSALIGELDKGTITEEDAEKLTDYVIKTGDLAHARAELTEKTNAHIQSEENYKKTLLVDSYATKTFEESLTTTIGSITSLASAITAVQGLGSIWKNEDLSLGQKVLQTVTTLGFVIPMLTRAFSQNSIMAMANVASHVLLGQALTKETIEALMGAKGFDILNVSLQGTAVTLGSALAMFLVVTAAIAALIYIIYKLVKAHEAEVNKVQDAKKAAQDLKQEYDDLKNSAQEFKDTIEDYQDGINNLKDLTKNTKEYNEALEESNRKARDLIEKYKLFDSYHYENGVIVIDEAALETVEKEQEKIVNNARKAYLEAELYANKVEQNKLLSDSRKQTENFDERNEWYNEDYAGAEDFATKVNKFGFTSDDAQVIIDYNSKLKDLTNTQQYYLEQLIATKIEASDMGEALKTLVNDDIGYYNELLAAQSKLLANNKDIFNEDTFKEVTQIKDLQSLRSFISGNYKLEDLQSVFGQSFDYSQLTEEGVAKYYASLKSGIDVNDLDYSKDKNGKITVTSADGEKIVNELNPQFVAQQFTKLFVQELSIQLPEELNGALNSIIEQANNTDLGFNLGEFIAKSIEQGQFDLTTIFSQLTQTEADAFNPQQILDVIKQAIPDVETQKQILAAMLGLDADQIPENVADLEKQITNLATAQMESYTVADNKAAANAEGEKAAEGAGIDVEAYKVYRNEIERTEESLHGQWEAVNKVALANMKLAKGLKTVAANWDEYNEILTDDNANLQDVAQVLGELKEPLAEILNMDMEDLALLPDNFAKENWDLITKAIDGVEGAVDELRDKAGEEILIQVSPEFDANGDGKLDAIYQEMHNKIAEYNNLNFEVGYNLDPVSEAEVFESFQSIINAAGGMSDALKEYFASMGYDVEVEDVTIPGDINHWRYDNPVIDVEASRQAGVAVFKGTEPITGTSQSPDSKAVAIKSITTNGNYGGSATVKKAAARGGGSRGSKGGGGGGGGKTNPAENQKITSKDDAGIKRYKEIDDAIEDLTKDQERLNKVTDAYYGANKVAYMKQQQKLLQKEIDLHKERFKWAQKYYEEDKAELDNYAKEKLGVEIEYDEDGSIKNYTPIMEDLYSQLNEKEKFWSKASNFSSKEAQDEYKKNNIDPIADTMKTFQGYVDQFDESNEERKKEMNEGIELMIEFKQHEYEIWQEGWKNQQDILEDQIKFLDHAKKMLGDSAADMGEALALTAGGDNNYVQNALDQLSLYNDKEQELHNLLAENKITQADYVKGMEEIRDVYLEQTENLKALDDEMMEYYGKVLDKVISEIKEYTDAMGKLNDQLDRYMKVMKLTGRELDYDAIGEILEAQQKVLQDQYTTDLSTLKMLREREQHWIQELKNQDTEEGRELIERQLKETREQILETENQVLDDLAAQAEKAAEILENARAKSMAVYEDMLTDGLGFDYIDGLLERQSTIQEEYLTKTNQVFETTKMLRKIQTDMDSTSNRVAKERLNNFSKEIENLKNRDKMTKADLELAQKRYDLLLAQIALEEAQKAKTTVRLQRDNEGNYGYVYTADEGDIAKAEDDMFNAENDLYNTRLRITNEYGEKIIQLNQEQADALNELWDEYYNKHSISEDEYEQKRAEIVDHYNELRKTYVHNYTEAQKEDARVVADAWINQDNNMIKSSTEWQKTTDKLISQTETAIRRYENTSDWLERQQERHLGNVREETEKVTTASDELKDKVNDEVIPAYKDLWDKVDAVYKKYSAERSEVLKNIKVYNDLATSLQTTIDKYRTLADVSDIKTFNSDGNVKGTNGNVKNQAGNASAGGTAGGGGNGGNNNPGYIPDNNLGKQEVKKVEQKPAQDTTLQAYLSTLNSNPSGLSDAGITYIVNKLGASSTAGQKALAIRSKRDEYNHLVSLGDNLVKNKTKYQRFQTLAAEKAAGKFNTGGYTGEWSDGSGKLAVLHSKELVLNAKDTENMLAVVDMVRQITNSIDMNAASLAGGYGALSSGGSGTAGPQTLEQNVQITASFPNATNHSEIEEAFNNLINKASQYASRTR